MRSCVQDRSGRRAAPHMIERMGKRRRRRRSRDSFWMQQYGGMPVWGLAAAAVAILVAAVIAVPAALTQPKVEAREPRPLPAMSQSNDAPLVAFIGDSYTAGDLIEGPAKLSGRWSAVASEQAGWEQRNYGKGGTGYTTRGPFDGGTTYSERLASLDGAFDAVIVSGGRNDTDPSTYEDAVTSFYAALREAQPNAQIFVIGPFWPNGYPTEALTREDEVVAQVAGDLGITYVSPTGAGWVTGTNDGTEPGNRVDLIGPDGTHPTAGGHAYFAERIIEEFAAQLR